jgi:hypothetical protein
MDIKNVHLVLQNRFTSKRIYKVSLSLTLMVFVFTMTPGSSLFNILKPVSAAPLTGVSVSPASNIKNEKATYDFFLTTKTTGTIKVIQIDFPSGFNLGNIRLIEKSGIGSGSLSVSGSTLKYTVSIAANVAAETTIRLEIGRIIATGAGSHTVSMKTINPQDVVIDGPTSSSSFTIKSINGNDVSPGFIKRKSLLDDAAGNAHGWNPDGSAKIFGIVDGDVSGPAINIFVSAIDEDGAGCRTTDFDSEENLMSIKCDVAPANNNALHYLITKLPANVVTSTSLPSSQSLLSSSIPLSPSDPFETGK